MLYVDIIMTKFYYLDYLLFFSRFKQQINILGKNKYRFLYKLHSDRDLFEEIIHRACTWIWLGIYTAQNN